MDRDVERRFVRIEGKVSHKLNLRVNGKTRMSVVGEPQPVSKPLSNGSFVKKAGSFVVCLNRQSLDPRRPLAVF